MSGLAASLAHTVGVEPTAGSGSRSTSTTDAVTAEPTTWALLRWLTGITRPVHGPLLVSATMRILHLLGNLALFALLGGGLVSLAQGELSVGRWVLALVAVAAVKASCAYIEQLTGHYVAFKALELLRTHVFSTLWPKAPMIVSQQRTGDLLASLTRDVDRIEVVYAHTFAPVVAAIVVPLIALTTVGAVWGWAIVAVPAGCVVVLLLALLTVGTRQSMAATQQTLAMRRDLAQHVTDSVFGAAEVVGYGRQEDRLDQMAELDAQMATAAGRSRRYVAVREALAVSLALISTTSVPLVGQAVGLPVPVVCALTAGSLRLFEGPAGVKDAVSYLDHCLAAARRLWQISHTPVTVVDGPRDEEFDRPVSVTWTAVSYTYPTAAQAHPVPDEVSLTVPAGLHVVVQGVSGSGKTTLVNLLQRYDDPDSGVICLDDVPITELTLRCLRRTVVAVSQRVELLNCSIADNLRLGVPEASDDDLWQALTWARLDDEVRAMSDGLDTRVGDKAQRLSGGQAQRLSLARALLMRPRVLVLDEFTASLNPELATQVRANLTEALPGVTIIEISHQADAGAHADQVVLLDRGRRICQLH